VPFSLLPRDEEFFDLFVEVARRSHQAADHMVGLFAEPARSADQADQIKRLEHECDQFTHAVVNRLDRTFITPIDREDVSTGSRAISTTPSRDRRGGTARPDLPGRSGAGVAAGAYGIVAAP
jgi:hypothetical protein